MNADEIKEREWLHNTRKFRLSIVGFIDLQGYGDDISKSEFNPMNPNSKEAIKRLRDFHKIVAKHSKGIFPTLVLNDSAIAYRDLNYFKRSVTYDFLIKSWRLYAEVNEDDPKGARMVIAVHFRKLGRRSGIDAKRNFTNKIISQLNSNEICAEEAIIRAANFKPDFDILPKLQANFAFAKAYVAEKAGSSVGLKANRFFVDSIIFNNSMENWIELEDCNREIEWSDPKLNLRAKFFSIQNINDSRQSYYEHLAGVRDAYQIVRCPNFYPNVSKDLCKELSSMTKQNSSEVQK